MPAAATAFDDLSMMMTLYSATLKVLSGAQAWQPARQQFGSRSSSMNVFSLLPQSPFLMNRSITRGEKYVFSCFNDAPEMRFYCALAPAYLPLDIRFFIAFFIFTVSKNLLWRKMNSFFFQFCKAYLRSLFFSAVIELIEKRFIAAMRFA